MKRVLLLALFLSFTTFAKPTPPPKLILQITIDQFSGNQLQRFKSHLDKGGFAFLIQHGIWYDNAHQYHATTETAVGHTTLATGAVPAVHGIIANEWFDKNKQKEVYSMEDIKYAVSPKNIMVPSFADALAMATNNQSKRFAVSTKDRGAIPLGGQMGKAFWLDKKTGGFTSTQYYYEALPSWVINWNQKAPVKAYLKKSWTLKEPCLKYQFCKDGKKHIKPQLQRFKDNFPHPYGDQLDETFITQIVKSPASDALTLDFAKHLVSAEGLGHDSVTDYLSISLSATDAIGHTFGPYSLESEDNFVRLNHELDDFFKFLDKKVGLQNVLIILSADHGAGPSPTFLSNGQYPAFEIASSDIMGNKAVQAVVKRYHLELDKLVINKFPNIYFNDDYLIEKKIDSKALAIALAKAIETQEGVYAAVPTFLIRENRYSHPYLLPLLKNQIESSRSGDIYLIGKPHVYFSDKHYAKANHGTPWRYDTHVPMIFVSLKFKPRRIHRFITTIDLAPTLAAILKIDPPSGSMGLPLKEVIISE